MSEGSMTFGRVGNESDVCGGRGLVAMCIVD